MKKNCLPMVLQKKYLNYNEKNDFISSIHQNLKNNIIDIH